ncbi:MAG: TetR/AcrR family transcriptional regulator [Myxococcaceae bacterium]|nr:TetR/AcrR family transcriptional regulator [Myxococcaceae bacterium]
MEATTQLLRELGPDGTTTARIARRAGTSVGSLYQYFPTREALVAAVAQRHLDALTATLARGLGVDAATAPLHDVISGLVAAAVEAHAEDPRVHAALITELARAGATDFAATTLEHLAALVEGLLSGRADAHVADPRLAAFLLVRLVDGLTHAAVLDAPHWLSQPAFTAEVVRLVEAWLARQAVLPEGLPPRATGTTAAGSRGQAEERARPSSTGSSTVPSGDAADRAELGAARVR